MIDQRLIRAAAAAEKAIPLADIDGLQRRGARLRKQRMAAVAGACAILLGCGSLAVAASNEPRVDPPVSPPRPTPSATPWPESITWTGGRLPPGTYSLATGEDAPVAQLTVPPGWRLWEGPARYEHGVPVATVAVLKVLGVPRDSCAGEDGRMRQVGSGAELVRALSAVPGYVVRLGPVADDRFGHPAIHLQLHVAGAARCAGPGTSHLLQTADGPVAGPPPGGTVDVWVVDVDGRTAVIYADATAAASVRATRDQREILASIDLEASSP